MTHYDN